MNIYFLPAFTISLQVTILFCTGIFNCLKPAALLMFGAGILLACRGRMFVWYDNFSHWALVVKNMLLTDRFPTFLDTRIIFQEYPMGSAS